MISFSPMIKTWQLDLICLLAGVLLTLSFAPFHVWVFAPIAMAILFASWSVVSPRRAGLLGLFFGVGFFGTAISWVFISIHDYGQTNTIMAGLITVLFVLLLSLLTPVLVGYITMRYCHSRQKGISVMAISSIWVLSEVLRSYFLTGFPWVLVGQSQVNSPLKGFFPIVGIYGVSWLTACLAMCLVRCVGRQQGRLWYGVCVVLIIASGYGLSGYHWTQAVGKPIKVALVQGNIRQEDKWDPSQLPNIINTYARLSAPFWQHNQLIIWPENAIPAPSNEITGLLAALKQQARTHETTLILGLPIVKDHDYYNGALALGKQTGQYLKHHLVPFGEYVPFGDKLRGLMGLFSIVMSDLSAGEKYQAPIQVGNTALSVLICYEIAYAQLVRRSAQQANVLLVLSDDSWFGRSSAGAQQLQMAQARALETGRYVLSATNNGKTAVINAQGHIVAQLPSYRAGALLAWVQPMQGNTPWLILGLWPILLWSMICLAAITIWFRRW